MIARALAAGPAEQKKKKKRTGEEGDAVGAGEGRADGWCVGAWLGPNDGSGVGNCAGATACTLARAGSSAPP
jgi:hypothetical protein